MVTQPIIDQIYRERMVFGSSGAKHKLQSHVDSDEGRFLTEFITARPDIVRTPEVGGAFGLSTLHITGATAGRAGAHHVIVDPDQSTAWHGIGVDNLRRAGTDAVELLEAPSETIDGWHTFDHTLVDLFYANRLIKVGGTSSSTTAVGRACRRRSPTPPGTRASKS